MGQAYELLGNLQESTKYYRRALNAFAALSDRINESATLYVLGRLELKQNDLEAAEADLKKSIEATEDIRRFSSITDLTTAFSAHSYDRYQAYVECLMRQQRHDPKSAFDTQAFKISELARGRALADLLQVTQTSLLPGTDPELVAREKFLRQSLKAREDYQVALLGTAYQKQELDALQQELRALTAEYRQLSDTIRARYPDYDRLAHPTAWDLTQIQQQVIRDDQTVLLEYSLGHEQSYVWLVTNKQLRSYELPAGEQIAEQARALYDLLKLGPEAEKLKDLTAAAQKLSAMILWPIAAELDKKRVIIVADGALNYIPFQILTLSPANTEPLVAVHEVINTPSASILGQLEEEASRRQPPEKVIAAFGDPAFAANYAEVANGNGASGVGLDHTVDDYRWKSALRDIEPDSADPAKIQPLHFAKKELTNLQGIAGETTFVAAGFDASREKLEGTDLRKYAILHFATHGVLDPKHPENSGLLLSMVDQSGRKRNGFLRLDDIYRLHAPVDLVVLSACRTGLGKDVRGEGLIGLTRGFMYAGASSVVASLWRVDDEATAELMKRFYSNMLQKDMTPAAALRAAQNSIRQEPQWKSPYYWAAFTLQGEYRNQIKVTPGTTRSNWGLAIVGFGLAVLLPVLFLSHRRMRKQLSIRP
jgi:CHAT domain-containing protein